MIRWTLCLVALAGCDALFDLDRLRDVPSDGRGDVGEIDPDSLPPNDGRVCIGHYMTVCPSVSDSHTFDVATTIDTTNDSRCVVIAGAQNYPEVCVIGGLAINVNAPVTVTGSRALVFAAIGAITVTQSGVIDASSTRIATLRRGPAANASILLGCTPTNGDSQMTSGNGGAGGGAGGSFGGTGGAGGMSDKGTSVNPNAAVGPTPPALRGGCAGAFGGESANANSKGAPGDSGGALLLVAGNAITINGVVMANGGGGGGAPSNTLGENAGGGGGGSGGMIVLDATTISALSPGIVAAEGAGGGGGGQGSVHGDPGGEWTSSNRTAAPAGGAGGGAAGSGGRGTVLTIVDAGPGGPFDGNIGGGAGGGGGGAGLTLVRGMVSQGSQIYPPPRALQ